MTDSSEIGRYGTLRLLKRHEPDTTVAFFPIDDEEVTFGRSKQCSVRLYYDCVSELHCTLQFSEQRKVSYSTP
jgi:FHA domain